MKEIKIFTKLLFKYLSLLIFSIFLIILIWIIFNFKSVNNVNDGINYPNTIISEISKDDQINLNLENKKKLENNNIWLLVLDENGKYIEDFKAPSKFKHDYTSQDIVQSTRWYMDDVPVFTYNIGKKIVILGYPENSFARYNLYWTIDEITSLIRTFFVMILAIIVLFFLFYYISNRKFTREIGPIIDGIFSISRQERIDLEEKGELVEIKRALNNSARAFEKLEEDRKYWLRGISHDIRTPLTIINGYTNLMEEKFGRAEEIDIIKENVGNIKEILESINYFYMLDGYNDKRDFEEVDLKKLIRELSADLLNGNMIMLEDLEIDLDICKDTCKILAKESLIKRAIRNILINSAVHNKSVNIRIILEEKDKSLILKIIDNGSISPEKASCLNYVKKTGGLHGLGIIIAKKIVKIHGGSLKFYYNNPGLFTEFIFEKAHKEK